MICTQYVHGFSNLNTVSSTDAVFINDSNLLAGGAAVYFSTLSVFNTGNLLNT